MCVGGGGGGWLWWGGVEGGLVVVFSSRVVISTLWWQSLCECTQEFQAFVLEGVLINTPHHPPGPTLSVLFPLGRSPNMKESEINVNINTPLGSFLPAAAALKQEKSLSDKLYSPSEAERYFSQHAVRV